MATAIGRSQPSVIEELLAEPQRFNFYQLVRLLEMLEPDSVSVAEGGDPSAEPVRFRSSFSLAFPPSDVVSIENVPGTEPTDRFEQLVKRAAGEAQIPTVTVSMLGLGGAHGPLPHPMTEWVLERNGARDFALRDFLDIFDHRLVSLLYRVRKSCRLGTEWTSPDEHYFTRFLYGLMGMLTDGLQDRLKVPDRALLRYTGLLSKQPRDAAGLERLLSDHFQVKVVCHQLRGAMRPIEEEQWTKLGLSGQNQMLGGQALLGTTIWDQQAGIELEIGPLPWERYLDFLPGKSGLTSLVAMARYYVGPEFDLFVSLVLKADDIPRSRLAFQGKEESASASPSPVATAAKSPPPVSKPALGSPQSQTASTHPVLGLTSFLTHSTKLHSVGKVALGAVQRYSDEPLRAAP